MEKYLKKQFAIFALPTILAFALAFGIPFLTGLYLSFCEFTTVTNAKFVGLDNYRQVFSDPNFINAFWFTVKVMLVSVLTVNIFAFLLALLLTQKLKGTNLFRTVFFMPNLIGGIVLGYIWQSIINGILVNFDMTMLMDSSYGFWGLIMVVNWQYIGYIMIIYIAGLQNVSTSVLEAADIDGATSLQKVFRIKLPLIMTSITIALFLTIANSFKMFDQNLALTNGGPGNQTSMLALDIYNTFYDTIGFEGVGQAKATIFFIVVAAIAVVQVFITRRKEVEN
ncbi:MAG: ABC transporter permease [Candidatus Epulonipiscioides saccharophilum]|nr:MAG: ABC transporter permease [Epulopiscium sp. AS2M-Bin001]